MKVIVLGAGYTGTAVIRALIARGDEVLATSRTVEGAAALTALGARGLVWTAPTRAHFQALPERVDGAVILFPPRGVEPDAVADVVKDVPRIVYCSSTSVYGDHGGGDVTEASPVLPDSPWSVARVAAEDALRRVSATIVRAAGIYGEGRNVIVRHAHGELRNAGDPKRLINLIHVDDLAAILLACLDRGEPGATYLAATGAPVAWQAMADIAVARTGRPLPPNEPIPTDPNLAMFYRESKRCRPTRFGDLGITLRYTDTLAALREMPFDPSGPRLGA